jgi:hypothetical protein
MCQYSKKNKNIYRIVKKKLTIFWLAASRGQVGVELNAAKELAL